jgi:hypothetical protein
MMVDKDPIPRPEIAHSSTNRDDLTGWLVAEDQWGLLLHVPAHDVARADPTDPGLNQRLTRPDLRDWVFLKADIGGIVKPCDFHGEP